MFKPYAYCKNNDFTEEHRKTKHSSSSCHIACVVFVCEKSVLEKNDFDENPWEVILNKGRLEEVWFILLTDYWSKVLLCNFDKQQKSFIY